ncbi:multidrug resistance transporter EmrB/QacA [Acetobacter pasteurianus NBRC 101655]|nr:multidrug resistance transporter EmrB/QacA [Acetobacter pasteurianus NBRC 101655]
MNTLTSEAYLFVVGRPCPVIGDMVTPQQRGRYQGLFTGAFAVSSVTGPFLGGVLTSALSWRWVFLVNLPIGILAFALIMLSLPVGRRERTPRIDYPGAVLLSIATTGFLLLFNSLGTSLPWTSPLTVLLLGATMVLFALFIRQEQRAPEPLISLDLLRIPAFSVCVAVLVGQKKALAIAVRNQGGRRRWSKLRGGVNDVGG